MKDRVDILYIGFLLGHGGDAIQMEDLAVSMARGGRRVKVIVPALETSADFAERCRHRGVRVERSPLLRADAQAAHQNPFDMLRLFSRNRAPIVHLHTGDVCLPRFATLAMDLLRLPPAFVTVHSPYDTLGPGDARARYWAAVVSRRFHKVFCPSDHSRATQIRYGLAQERVQTIHNSVDLDRYGHGDPTSVRSRLGLAPDAPLIVFTSRMDAQKRPLDALAAFARIASDFPAAHLVFVGTGALTEEATKAAARARLTGRVHFVGHQPNIPDWLAAATVWLLPTEAENFSLAVLEALAAGCPIISTQCPGNDEVLIDNENALTTSVGDIRAQADALRRLLHNEDLRTRLSRAARMTSRSYSQENMVRQYWKCYTENAGRPQPVVPHQHTEQLA